MIPFEKVFRRVELGRGEPDRYSATYKPHPAGYARWTILFAFEDTPAISWRVKTPRQAILAGLVVAARNMYGSLVSVG